MQRNLRESLVKAAFDNNLEEESSDPQVARIESIMKSLHNQRKLALQLDEHQLSTSIDNFDFSDDEKSLFGHQIP